MDRAAVRAPGHARALHGPAFVPGHLPRTPARARHGIVTNRKGQPYGSEPRGANPESR